MRLRAIPAAMVGAAMLVAMAMVDMAYGQATFLRGAPDVPIPAGATEMAASPVTLEGPAGRYTVSFVGAAVPWTDHMAFYRATLPELGWSLLEQSETALLFARGRDQLTIRFVDNLEEGELVIVLELQSSPASQALD